MHVFDTIEEEVRSNAVIDRMIEENVPGLYEVRETVMKCSVCGQSDLVPDREAEKWQKFHGMTLCRKCHLGTPQMQVIRQAAQDLKQVLLHAVISRKHTVAKSVMCTDDQAAALIIEELKYRL